jgi:flagellar hook-basal body complex protein FliE
VEINKINLNSIANNSSLNTKTTEGTQNLDFSKILNDSLDKLNNLENESSSLDQLLAIGEVDNIHDVTIAAQKAELALSLAVNIQGKVIEAYKEIMRLQL